MLETLDTAHPPACSLLPCLVMLNIPSQSHCLHPIDRRSFLVARGMSYFGIDLAGRVAAAPTSQTARRQVAKSAIMIWLSGGASHIDTWDMKPDTPEEYRTHSSQSAQRCPVFRSVNTCR
ncbi:MAG: DUF1501 domain-containing protein, partial [Gemmataceae bacterium]